MPNASSDCGDKNEEIRVAMGMGYALVISFFGRMYQLTEAERMVGAVRRSKGTMQKTNRQQGTTGRDTAIKHTYKPTRSVWQPNTLWYWTLLLFFEILLQYPINIALSLLQQDQWAKIFYAWLERRYGFTFALWRRTSMANAWRTREHTRRGE